MKNKVKKRFLFFLCLAAGLMIIALLAPYLVPNDPYETNPLVLKAPPCAKYPFGTDKFGRCILSRVLMGAQTSIFCAVLLVLITFLVGTLLGVLCGYYGGILDALVMRLADILMSLPEMVLAIAVAGVLGGSIVNAMIALGFAGWTTYARLAKSQVLIRKKEYFISAAKMGGCSDLHIISFHILPNIIGPLIVNATSKIGTTMIGFAGLSFLGLGVQVPMAEWGSMINEARAYLQLTPWAVLFPGAAIVLTVSVFNLLGDAARDLLDVEGCHE
ncbi:MAG: ABC transporter permease [Blautia sp.]|uniref:ABC transporter permease n=1 Tax=Blautia sp. TaxID=1955243 RepID=UPI0039940B4F